jgi:hypothetical protein
MDVLLFLACSCACSFGCACACRASCPVLRVLLHFAVWARCWSHTVRSPLPDCSWTCAHPAAVRVCVCSYSHILASILAYLHTRFILAHSCTHARIMWHALTITDRGWWHSHDLAITTWHVAGLVHDKFMTVIEGHSGHQMCLNVCILLGLMGPLQGAATRIWECGRLRAPVL